MDIVKIIQEYSIKFLYALEEAWVGRTSRRGSQVRIRDKTLLGSFQQFRHTNGSLGKPYRTRSAVLFADYSETVGLIALVVSLRVNYHPGHGIQANSTSARNKHLFNGADGAYGDLSSHFLLPRMHLEAPRRCPLSSTSYLATHPFTSSNPDAPSNNQPYHNV